MVRYPKSITILALFSSLYLFDAQAFELPEGVHVGVGLENGGNDAVGPNYLTGYLKLEDKLGYGEIIKLETTNSSDLKELRGITLGYEQPLNEDWGLELKIFNGSWSRPNGHSSEYLKQKNDDFALSGTIKRTFIPNDKLASQISLGIQTMDVSNKQKPLVEGVVGDNYKQKTRDIVVSVAVEYNFSDGVGLYSDLTIEKGLGWLDPEHFRLNVDDTPTVLRYSGEFTYNLSDTFQAVVKGALQWTPDRLNQTKMFSLGGGEYAVGYPGGEGSGDIGGGIRIELNWVGEIALNEENRLYYKPFIFVDGGFTRVNNPINDSRTGEDEGSEQRASAGLGLAVETGSFHASVQIAYPLSGESVFGGDADDPRILFSVGLRN